MLPPRPIGGEPAPRPLPPPDDGRLWDLHERVTRLETDRKWLGAALLVLLLGAGIIGPLTGAWLSGQRAERYEAEAARLDEQVRELDRDVEELLTAVVAISEERSADRSATAPVAAATAPATSATAPVPVPAPPRTAQPAPPRRPIDAAAWAQVFGSRVVEGPLDPDERAAMREEWDRLPPVVQEQTLTAMLRRFGLDPETFLTELEEPAYEVTP